MQVNGGNNGRDKVQGRRVINKNGRVTIEYFKNELTRKIRPVKYMWKIIDKDRISGQKVNWTYRQSKICLYNYFMHDRMHLHAD